MATRTSVQTVKRAPHTHEPITQRLKLLYVVPGTRKFAGIERVVDEIATELADKYAARYDVDVLYLSHFDNHVIGPRPYNTLQTEPDGRAELLRTVRRAVSAKEYDLVVVPQIEATVICFFACLGLSRRFVLHLHGNPSRERSHLKAKILFEVMRTLVLPRLASVFGTSPRQLAAFQDMFPSDVPHVWVPNPVRRFDETARPAAASGGQVQFVSVARFAYQKGQDLLLDAFARLHKQRTNARLRIVGYGPEEVDLRRRIEAHGLGDVVSIEHHPESPALPLATSDVYVCTSRWEGWSLAICEALRFGLPVVSVDCEFGPSDILTEPRLGRLVPYATVSATVDGLVDAMRYYCDNLASEAQHAELRKGYVERFSVDQVVHAHAAAIAAAIRH
jgi:glycosyltransferase involved in cell wall biosynthesis